MQLPYHGRKITQDPLKTVKSLEKVLVDRGIDENTTECLVTFLSEALLKSAEAEIEKEKAATAQKQKESIAVF